MPLLRGSANGRKGGSSWKDEHVRALLLPIIGVVAIMVIVGLDSAFDIDQATVVAAITAVITLTASAAGHAAGAASKDRSGPGDEP